MTNRHVNAAQPYSPLPPLELRILFHAAQGHSNAEIGERVGMAEDSVATKFRRVCRRLGARNRTHAVAIAFAPTGFVLVPDSTTARAGREPLLVPRESSALDATVDLVRTAAVFS